MTKYIDSEYLKRILQRVIERLKELDAEREIVAIESVIKFLKVMERFHSVDVVYGHWEKYTTEYGYEAYRCSVCYQPWKEGLNENWNYCPHCGAKMDGEC